MPQIDLDCLTECQAMSKGGGAGESLGKQQDPIGFLSFGNLLNTAVFVEEPRDSADNVLAHRLQQEVGGFGEIREHGTDRHGERAGSRDDGWRLPSRIRRAELELLPRIEISSHRVHTLWPVLVQDELAEARVTFERQSEQILRFTLVPIGRGAMHEAANGGHRCDTGIKLDLDIGP